MPAAGNGDLAVLGAVIISVAVFAVTRAALGTLLGSEVVTIAGLLLYLYVAEPLLSRITALGSVTAYLPGVAADGLTQASQAGVRLLPAGQGGLLFTAWAAAIACAGTVVVARRDITCPKSPGDHVTPSVPTHVLHAIGLDLPSVDRGLLIRFADARQVREEVRPIGDRPDVKPCPKFAEDLPPGMQTFGLGPGPQVGLPRLA